MQRYPHVVGLRHGGDLFRLHDSTRVADIGLQRVVDPDLGDAQALRAASRQPAASRKSLRFMNAF